MTLLRLIPASEVISPENPCSYPDCKEEAAWTRKPAWMLAGVEDVCDAHHSWTRIKEIR